MPLRAGNNVGTIEGVAATVLERVRVPGVRQGFDRGAPDPRQRQYATAVVVAVAVATAAGWVFNLAGPAVTAGLTVVFALVGAGGHSLKTDLVRFVWYVPLVALVMAIGPLLHDIPVLAGLLVAAVVFGSGMLPALGERYRVVGQTFAAATLAATTTGIGSHEPAKHLFAAAFGGALFALLLRIVVGLTDPGKATRLAVARALTEPGPGVMDRAASEWRDDGAPTWLGEVLAGAARFRAARETLLVQAEQADPTEAGRLRAIVACADSVAAELAVAVRARACTGLPPQARIDPAAAVVAQGGRQDLPPAARGINSGLDQIRAAVHQRSETPASAPESSSWRQRLRSAVHAHMSLRSSLFRHALRCTLAVVLGMVIVLWLRGPSASTLLLTLYVVLQPAARDSTTGALERTGGAVLGVTMLSALITLVPGQYAYVLVPALIAGMLLGVERLRSEYQMLLATVIAVVVVDQAMDMDRPLVNVAISFAANSAIGAAVALIVGYVSYLALPGSLVPDVKGALRAAVWATSELLRSIRVAGRSGRDLAGAIQWTHMLALRRTQDLLGMPALLNGTNADPEDERVTREAALALDALRADLANLAFRPAEEQPVAAPALQAVDTLLAGQPAAKIPDVPVTHVPATELLASSLVENALHARRSIDELLGCESPWKSYTVSFVRPQRLRIK